MQRVEIGAVTFGPIQIHDFHTADQFNPLLLQASGDTPMGEAIMTGLDMLEARKAQYKQAGVSYYRPWVWLITDGGPTDPWQQVARRACMTATVTRASPSSSLLSGSRALIRRPCRRFAALVGRPSSWKVSTSQRCSSGCLALWAMWRGR